MERLDVYGREPRLHFPSGQLVESANLVGRTMRGRVLDKFAEKPPAQPLERNETVISRLWQKKELLDAGDPAHKEIRPVLLLGGGGMRGVFGASVLESMAAMGLTNAFDRVVTASAGTANGAYFLSGQGWQGLNIYRLLAEGRDFIGLKRGKPFLDIGYMGLLMREAVPLDEDAVRASRPEFMSALTNAVTGEREIIDMKKLPPGQMVTAVMGSCAIPILFGETVRLGDKEYVDGETSGTPGDAALAKDSTDKYPTDLVVLLNSPQDPEDSKPSMVERALVEGLMKKSPDALRRQIVHRHGALSRMLSEVTGVNVQIVAPEKQILRRTTKNSNVLWAAVEKGREMAQTLFAEPTTA